jgi:hypothetical protein
LGPCRSDCAVSVQDYADLDSVSCADALPPSVIAPDGRLIGSQGHIADRFDDLVVAPGTRELVLARVAGVPAMPAAYAVSITVQNMVTPLRGDVTEAGHVVAELSQQECVIPT